MDINATSAAAYMSSSPAPAVPMETSSQLSTPDSSGGGIISVLKDAVELEGNLALKLVEAGLEASFTEDKMAIAQQIIDVYA